MSEVEQGAVSYEVVMPEEVEDVLWSLGQAFWRLRETLRPHRMTEAWIAGLVAAGYKAGAAKEWGSGKFPRALPFVIEMECPFGHRTEDRRDYAKVRLIIEDNGWWSLDPKSPCPRCTPTDVERWLLTCARCEAGEDCERHYPAHSPLDVTGGYDLPDAEVDYDDSGRGFDAAPLAWVLREFLRLAKIAYARWWIERTDEAAEVSLMDRRVSDDYRQRYISNQLASAREVLGAVPQRGRRAVEAPKRTTAEVGAWLDEYGVPTDATVRQAWELVKAVPGRPAKNAIEAALSARKSSGTTA